MGDLNEDRGQKFDLSEIWNSRRLPRPVIDAVSGAIAGGVSRFIVSPLDVIKIRFQVQIEPIQTWNKASQVASNVTTSKYTGLVQAARDIVREEGIVGLWRGTVPAQLLVMPYTAIQFVVIHKFMSLVAGSTKSENHGKLSSATAFVGGSIAGCAATVGSYPFDLLRTILASQGEPKVYPNMRAAYVGLVRTRGFRGLFAGLAPTLTEIVPYAGLQFGCYDIFKKWTAAQNKKHGYILPDGEVMAPGQKFVCGLAAGMVAKVVCHPLDVVKKRYQVQGLQRHLKYGARVELQAYRNIIDAIQQIVRHEGWHGLYKGTLPSVIKAAPAAAITFLVYERMSQWLDNSEPH